MAKQAAKSETRIALFQRKEVPPTLHNNEWWFVVADVVASPGASSDPRRLSLNQSPGHGN